MRHCPKEMVEQGVITEEEFNQKKAEMMARI
ncbi:MAG: SHOCT domain-containing protein [Ruminococcus callidus]|nr:SHOCT domain-containing protein [Ruminococcus callidus]